MEPNYWVVGAMFSGKDDMLPAFLERGYWYCWDPNRPDNKNTPSGRGRNSPADQQKRFEEIKAGDQIAVKKMLGQGAVDIEIRALGIVKAIDEREWRIYVDWLTKEPIARNVPIKGCTASIHGPFQFNSGDAEKDQWLHQIFCI